MQGLKEFGQSVVLQGNGLIIEKTESKRRWWGRKFKKKQKQKTDVTHENDNKRVTGGHYGTGKQIIWVFSFTHSSSSGTKLVFLSTVLFCFLLRSQLSTNHTVWTWLFFPHNQFKVALRAKTKLNHGTCWIGVLVSKTWGRCHSVFDILDSF